MESEKPDDPWVARLRSDSATRDDAIRELSDLLTRGLSKSLSGRYGGGLQTEDIVQDAMIKILDSLDSFEERSKFTTWAMTIATRIGISELRRKRYSDVSLNSHANDDSVSFDVPDSGTPASESGLDRHSLLEELKRLIASDLTEKQRVALQAYLTGLPVEEIARKTRSNRNAVYKLIHDARTRLKAGFEKTGLMADDVIAILA